MADEAGRTSSPSSATPTPPPAPATKIGSYRLLQPLGTGGMSSVFRATHEETGLEVALKILPRSLAKNTILLQRFLREAKIAESLEHPNIVAIYDRGTEQGRYYLVLEYVSGGDLHDWVRTHGPMPVSMAMVILKGVVSGLDYAAQKGLIHRDIKPANILLTEEGTAKITDLGLAVQLADEDERVTRAGTTVGTVDYMSPEQARDSRSTTVSSDIYSLGCTLYHLLAGVPPFAGGTVPEKLKRHATESAPEITRVRTDIPESLARILRKMLSKKADQRFSTYGELLRALESVVPLPASDDAALYALVDDEEADSEGDFLLQPEDDDGALIPLSTREGVPVAGLPTRDLQKPGGEAAARSGATASNGVAPGAELDLGALAELDEESEPPSHRGRKSRMPTGTSLNDVIGSPSAGGLPGQRGAEVAGRSMPPMSLAPRSQGSTGNELQEGIVRGLLIGGALVVFGLVVAWALSHRPDSEVVDEDAFAGEVAGQQADAAPIVDRPPTAALVIDSKLRLRVASAPAWNEPSDRQASLPAEPPLSASLESGFEPEWVRDGVTEVEGLSVLRVSRLVARDWPAGAEGDGSQESPAPAVVEIADDGPFYKADLELAEGTRLIRAAAGYRPLIILGVGAASKARAQESVVTLPEGANVTLEGLDLVVDQDALPETVNSLFAIASGSLVLRDCSVTVMGNGGRRLALARVGNASKEVSQAPRLMMERTWINGRALTAVEILAGAADVVLSRCVILSGDAPVISVPGLAAAGSVSRGRVFSNRSILMSKRCLFEVATTRTLPPLTIRALGSTMARQSGESAAPGTGSLIVLLGEAPMSVSTAIDWAGDLNQHVGWSDWLSLNQGGQKRIEVAGLSGAQALWKAQEARSQEGLATIDLAARADLRPADLAAVLPGLKSAEATLARVRDPQPYLQARSVGQFEPLPEVVKPPPPPPASARELVFSTAGSPWKGDLGRFLNEQLQGMKTDALFVRVKGQGRHAMSPVTVPEGISLWIEVDPSTEANDPVVWSAPAMAPSSEFLLATKRGDLTLRGVRIDAGAMNAGSLIRVEEGHLVMEDCQLLGQRGQAEAGEEPCLVSLLSPSTREIDWRLGDLPSGGEGVTPPMPTARLDRCIMDTAGVALRAEFGRGAILVRESAIAGGAAVFDLVPSPVSRDRFLADLRLSRSTVAAGREVVRFEAWTGASPGPDRPWLISSERCVFLDVGTPPGRVVSLRLVPDAQAQRGLFWQSRSDDYEMAPRVAVEGQVITSLPRENGLLDWKQYWGPSHVADLFSADRPAARASGTDLTPGSLRLRDLELQAVGTAGPLPVGAPAELFEEKAPAAPTIEEKAGVSSKGPAQVGPAPGPLPAQGGVPF